MASVAPTGDNISIPGYTITPPSTASGNFRVFDGDTSKIGSSLILTRGTLRHEEVAKTNFESGGATAASGTPPYREQNVTGAWLGTSLTASGNVAAPGNFLTIYQDGVDVSGQWYLYQIDTATFQSITAATSVADAKTALQGFDTLYLYPAVPVLSPGVYTAPTKVRIEIELPNDTYSVHSAYVNPIHMEATTWRKALMMEFQAKGYTPLFQEFEVWKSPLFMEFQADPYTPMHLEFLTIKAPMNIEFTPTPDGAVVGATGGLIVSDTCATATLALTVPGVVDGLDVGEQFEWAAYRYGVQLDTEINTDTSWSFDAPSDGVYNVQAVRIKADGSRVLENNVDYFIDCRTLKCISRIAKEDVELSLIHI